MCGRLLWDWNSAIGDNRRLEIEFANYFSNHVTYCTSSGLISTTNVPSLVPRKGKLLSQKNASSETWRRKPRVLFLFAGFTMSLSLSL